MQDTKTFAVGDKVVFADPALTGWQGGLGKVLTKRGSDGYYDVEILEMPPNLISSSWHVGSTMSDFAKNLKLVEDIGEAVAHPAHYGGDTTYEAIKVIEAWGLGFHLGNTVKYISRAGKKDKAKLLEDLKKALWYLQRKIAKVEEELSTLK